MCRYGARLGLLGVAAGVCGAAVVLAGRRAIPAALTKSIEAVLNIIINSCAVL